MKLIEFKEYDNLNQGRALNKKKSIIFALLVCIVVAAIVFAITYIVSPKFRNWADMKILMKAVYEGNLSSIEIESNNSTYTYAFDKYIVVLNENKLSFYNSSGKEVNTLNLSVSNPIYKSNGKYLAVAEKEKHKLYLISGTKEMWSTDVEGDISRVSVNENGYVSVVCSGTTYKSVILIFDQSGKQLLKTYIPNNLVVDTALSSDNKYFSYAEVDTSGTIIKSTVKTIIVKDASDGNEIKIQNQYEMDSNSIIVNIKYQGSKNLICMCNNGTYLLADGNKQLLQNYEENNNKISFAGIEMFTNIYEIEENAGEVANQESKVKLINTGTRKQSEYKMKGMAKSVISAGNTVAVNMGTEIYFVSTRGWLKKKYVANQEIKDVIISDRIAAIVFRDKIEILVL